jgi:hypothetical protein
MTAPRPGRDQAPLIAVVAFAVLLSGGVTALLTDDGAEVAPSAAPAASVEKLAGAVPSAEERRPAADEEPEVTDLCSREAFRLSDFGGDARVEECAAGWAYVTDAAGLTGTEAIMRHGPDAWRTVTELPTATCAEDLAGQGAPPFVVDRLDSCAAPPPEMETRPGTAVETQCTVTVDGETYFFRGGPDLTCWITEQR